MDDFEKNYPNFDWKNTPMKEHPNGTKCPCPKHEFIREQANTAATTRSSFVMKFCPDHYRVYFEEILPTYSRLIRLLLRFSRAIGAVQIKKLTYMQSDQCFYCKFGSGGRDKKSELPPI